jgi:hypothetical protein
MLRLISQLSMGSRLRGNDVVLGLWLFGACDSCYSATSKSTTTLSVTGKLWQLSTKPRATS